MTTRQQKGRGGRPKDNKNGEESDQKKTKMREGDQKKTKRERG